VIGVEEGVFHPRLPRYVRRMPPLKRERHLRGQVPRTFRFRVNTSQLHWSSSDQAQQIIWCRTNGVQGWARRGLSFLFDREVDAVGFVMRWG
jgi:hypothetical protein